MEEASSVTVTVTITVTVTGGSINNDHIAAASLSRISLLENPRSSKNLMGQAKTSLGYAVFVHGYPVPIHLVNHMQAGCAYAPMHGIQFSETTTEKYSTEQKF